MKQIFALVLLAFALTACKKNGPLQDGYTYYEVGFKTPDVENWRDTAFVVRTNNTQLIQKADVQLSLPLAERQLVFGELAYGNGGFNRNAGHWFNWHFPENSWNLVDVTAEIYDGRPYSDVEVNADYWQNQMQQYGSWGSYIRKKLPGKPK